MVNEEDKTHSGALRGTQSRNRVLSASTCVPDNTRESGTCTIIAHMGANNKQTRLVQGRRGGA